MRNEENVSIWPFFNGREAVTRIPPKRGNLFSLGLYLLFVTIVNTNFIYRNSNITIEVTYRLLTVCSSWSPRPTVDYSHIVYIFIRPILP